MTTVTEEPTQQGASDQDRKTAGSQPDPTRRAGQAAGRDRRRIDA